MPAWETADNFLRKQNIRIGGPTLGQTVAPRAYASLHPLGRARDYGNANSDVAAVAQAFKPLATGPNPAVVELFWSPGNVFYKNGQPFTPDSGLRSTHNDHVHVGIAPGADLSTATPGGSAPAAAVVAGNTGGISALLGALKSKGTAVRVAKVIAGGTVAVAAIGMVVT